MRKPLPVLCFCLSTTFFTPPAHAALFGWFAPKPHFTLIEAADLGNIKYVHSLIRHGAAIDETDQEGKTALLHAAEHGDPQMTQLLLQAGANIGAFDNKGNTALHLAAAHDHMEVARELVHAGAPLDLKNDEGFTPLQQAIQAKSIGVIQQIDPKALKVVTTDTAFPVIAAAAAVTGGGGVSTSTIVTVAGAAAAGGGAAIAAGGGGGGGAGGSSSSGSTPSSPTTRTITLPGAPQNLNPTTFETAEYYDPNPNNGIYGLHNIHASSAYARGYTGDGIIVGVVDTGVDLTHPDLQPNILNSGWDFVNNDNSADDDNLHGTHVAGIIAATKNSVGMHGVAYDAKILPVKVLDATGSGNTSDVSDGIDYATTHNAQVINISLGANFDMPDVHAAVQTAVSNGVIVVAAAGNSALSQPFYPARYAADTNVNNDSQTGILLAVGAVDANNNLASFSNQCGVAKDYCLVAPGVDVLSTFIGGAYTQLSGTSMADPYVSGAAAVLLQAFPFLTPRDVGLILLNTAHDLGAAGVDDVYGHGLVDLEAATRPNGTVVIPLSLNVNGNSANLASSSIHLSSAFGDALEHSSLKLAVLDDFNRPYTIDLHSLVATSAPALDSARALFDLGDSALTHPTQLNESATLYLSQAPVFEPHDDNPAATPDHTVRMSLISQTDNTTISAHMHVPFGQVFGYESLSDINTSNTLASDAFSSPFLGFADDVTASSLAYNSGNTHVRFGSFFGRDSQTAGQVSGFVNDITRHFTGGSSIGVQSGFLNETGSFLGSQTSGAFASDSQTPTWFYGMQAKLALSENDYLFATYSYGSSAPQAASDSLLANMSRVDSQAFGAGFVHHHLLHDNDTIGLSISQPLRVTSANATFDIPVARDFDGNIARQSVTSSLTPSGHETDMETFYHWNVSENNSLTTTAMLRHEPGNIADAAPEGIFLMKWKHAY